MSVASLDRAIPAGAPGLTLGHYLRAARVIITREALRFVYQRGRFIAALVRPLVWLFIFAAGFRSVLGVSIQPPYQTYILYEVYITPGLCGMILLFAGLQSSLAMVYDREMGSMRVLLVSPLPRWYLLFCKLLAGTLVAVAQCYVFLAIAYFWGVEPPPIGYLTVLPALVLAGFMLGSLGLLMSSLIKQLENFAGVMNFVIFPMFFASSALYPLWRVREFERAAVADLLGQPVHPCGRADPLRPARPVRADPVRGHARLHDPVPRPRGLGLRPRARLHGGAAAPPEAGAAPPSTGQGERGQLARQSGPALLERGGIEASLARERHLDLAQHPGRRRRQQRDPIGERDRLAQVVGDEQHGRRVRAQDVEQEAAQPLRGRLVQRHERLVHQAAASAG